MLTRPNIARAMVAIAAESSGTGRYRYVRSERLCEAGFQKLTEFCGSL
jgi:hypothetical protein